MFLGVFAPAALACVEPERVGLIKGEQPFVQTRLLKGVPRPLVSSGAVRIEGDGVIWKVSDPFEIITRITPAGVTQSIEGGPAEPVGPAGGGNPFFQEAGLIDLIRGDLSNLETLYGVQRHKRASPEGWRLDLKPKTSSVSEYISAIGIEGCDRVEQIAVRQANGDVIDIRLRSGSE